MATTRPAEPTNSPGVGGYGAGTRGIVKKLRVGGGVPLPFPSAIIFLYGGPRDVFNSGEKVFFRLAVIGRFLGRWLCCPENQIRTVATTEMDKWTLCSVLEWHPSSIRKMCACVSLRPFPQLFLIETSLISHVKSLNWDDCSRVSGSKRNFDFSQFSCTYVNVTLKSRKAPRAKSSTRYLFKYRWVHILLHSLQFFKTATKEKISFVLLIN